MTREEKIELLNKLLEIEEKNDIGNLTRAERGEFQQWIDDAIEQEPCEDAISRQAVLDATVKRNSIWNKITNSKGENLEEIILQLPPVNPQEPRKGYLSIDDVMSVFDDFMCGEVDEDGTETFLEMLKDKAESEDGE